MALKGNQDVVRQVRGHRCRKAAHAHVHFPLEKFSLLGNQRLGKEEGRDGVQR